MSRRRGGDGKLRGWRDGARLGVEGLLFVCFAVLGSWFLVLGAARVCDPLRVVLMGCLADGKVSGTGRRKRYEGGRKKRGRPRITRMGDDVRVRLRFLSAVLEVKVVILVPFAGHYNASSSVKWTGRSI